MTKEEKIDILKKLMKMNFKINFMRPDTIGLCGLFKKLGYDTQLQEDIPELLPPFKREDDIFWFWWETEGLIIPWWKRHIAIYRTIKKLKKS